MCQDWAARFEADRQAGVIQVDSGLARDAMALFLHLPTTATRQVLLCTDLHAGNILSAQREPWLAIDPKPFVGDPTYDVLQHLLNCGERLHRDPKSLVVRLAGLLDLDSERLQQWLFARCVYQSGYWEKDGLDQVALSLLR